MPTGVAVYADKAYNAAADEASFQADTSLRVVPLRRASRRPTSWADKLALREHRKRIETRNRQLEALGRQRLHARTTVGLELKVHASLVAVAITNAP